MVSAVLYSKYEIAICNWAYSNVNGKNVRRQYLVGSLTGAVSSQKVTEEYIKVI
jgi:hypothetical protein